MFGDLFQFDEATDTVDGYIYKVKQVAALLDYGVLANIRAVQKHIAQQIILFVVSQLQFECHNRDSQTDID